MARYEAEHRYIASIYPGRVEPQRRHYGLSRESLGPRANRSTLFELEPVPRGEAPFILRVTDSFEDVLDVLGQSGTEGGHKPKLTKPVGADDVVRDLLSCWTGGLFNVPSDAKPGIIEIAGTRPAAGEMVQMLQQQTVYFEFLFNEGERLHKANEWKEITDVMRLGAEWLQRNVIWANRSMAADSVPCPLCTTIIPGAAVFCPQCRQQIRALPAEIAALRTQQPARM
jgi:hypothetical protein